MQFTIRRSYAQSLCLGIQVKDFKSQFIFNVFKKSTLFHLKHFFILLKILFFNILKRIELKFYFSADRTLMVGPF